MGLEGIRQVMADWLNDRGVPAVTAWPVSPRQEREEPVVVVSLRSGTTRRRTDGKSGMGKERSSPLAWTSMPRRKGAARWFRRPLTLWPGR